MRTFVRYFFHVIEIVMALMFLNGAYAVAHNAQTENYDGLLGQVVSDPKALALYSLWWAATGFALILSKCHKNFQLLRAPALASMYLACAYVLSLSWILNGFGWHLTQAAVVGMLAAAAYLRVKTKKRRIEILEEGSEHDDTKFSALRQARIREAYQRANDSRNN